MGNNQTLIGITLSTNPNNTHRFKSTIGIGIAIKLVIGLEVNQTTSSDAWIAYPSDTLCIGKYKHIIFNFSLVKQH